MISNGGVIARTLYYRRDPNQSGSLLNLVSTDAPHPSILNVEGKAHSGAASFALEPTFAATLSTV